MSFKDIRLNHKLIAASQEILLTYFPYHEREVYGIMNSLVWFPTSIEWTEKLGIKTKSLENTPSLQLWFPATNNSSMTAMQTSELGAILVESSWNVMAHGDAREGKWRWNWRIEWRASTLNTTSEHGASSITTAHVHTSAASNRLNWHPRWFKWTCPFCRKMKSGFCACAIIFQTQSTT
jgi:hypothetical protein